MTIDQLKSRRKAGYATELHLAPSEYAQTLKDVTKHLGKKPERDPQRYTEHFLFEGLRIIRTFDF